ncbi:hypothetical protein, partial [uncultured Ruminococcus sp.]|uniref:hypothetical protein n=1 Tax=uncultured Ruminococcus sp. TaxID=165186 RepID=UPI002594BE40
AGGLSPGKYFLRSMQQNLPKRHVYTLVKTGSKSKPFLNFIHRTEPAVLCGVIVKEYFYDATIILPALLPLPFWAGTHAAVRNFQNRRH